MLTPSKLIVLGIILGVIWVVFRTIERRNNVHSSHAKEKKSSSTLDLEQCNICGAWVNTPCDKKDCPISG